MRAPAQSMKVSSNLKLQLLEEWKPIKKLRVLSLNERKVSWVEDAKNCARIYSRMLQAKAVCPKLLPLLSRWASRLLKYAEDYGFGCATGAHLVGTSPNILESNIWLYRLLIEIEYTKSSDKIYLTPVKSFYWSALDLGSTFIEDTKGCSITHLSWGITRFGCYWRTVLEDGRVIDSRPTEAFVFQRVEKLIHNGLKRHSKASVRLALSRKIRARNKR